MQPHVKATLVVSSIIAIAIAFVVVSKPENAEVTSDVIVSRVAEGNRNQQATALAFNLPGSIDDAESIGEAVEGQLTPNQLLDQEEWKVSRGFITDETRFIRKLPANDLDMLIEQGSTVAMRVRGARLLSDPGNMFRLFEDAIVLGDIPALLTAASLWPSQGVSSDRELLAVSDDSTVNMLAIMLTAKLRGDNVLTPEWQSRLLTGVDLSDAQVAKACTAAQRLLDRLEAERATRGLPPFDNSPSPHGEDWQDASPISATCN